MADLKKSISSYSRFIEDLEQELAQSGPFQEYKDVPVEIVYPGGNNPPPAADKPAISREKAKRDINRWNNQSG